LPFFKVAKKASDMILSIFPPLQSVYYAILSPNINNPSMKRMILFLGIISLILCSACEKQEPLSPEAEAMKLLILNDIDSIFQGWNSDEEMEEWGETSIELPYEILRPTSFRITSWLMGQAEKSSGWGTTW
jgi:hypothetical protein